MSLQEQGPGGAVANPQKGSTVHSATNQRQSASSGQTVIFLGRPDIGNRSVSLSLLFTSHSSILSTVVFMEFFDLSFKSHSSSNCPHFILQSVLQLSISFPFLTSLWHFHVSKTTPLQDHFLSTVRGMLLCWRTQAEVANPWEVP